MNSLLILFYFILFSCSLLLGNAHLLLDGSFLVYNDYDLLPVVYLLGAVCQVIVILLLLLELIYGVAGSVKVIKY